MSGLTNQTFLTVRTVDGRVLGLVAIPSTSFVGNETSISIPTYQGGLPVPLLQVAFSSQNTTVSRTPAEATQVTAFYPGYAKNAIRDQAKITYMSILATNRQATTAFAAKYTANQIAKANQFQGDPDVVVNAQGVPITAMDDSTWRTVSSLSSFLPVDDWKLAPGYAIQWFRSNFFIDFLSGKNTAAVTPVVPPMPPVITPGSISLSWKANMTNTTTCSFFEVNWVEALALQDSSVPNRYADTITLGPISADPSSEGLLKAFVVSTQGAMTPMANGVVVPLMSTLRFVKATDMAIASGTYTWPCTVTSTTSGLTATGTISIVLP